MSRDLQESPSGSIFWDPSDPANKNLNLLARKEDDNSAALTLEELASDFGQFRDKLRASMVRLLAYKYEKLERKLAQYESLNTKYYAAVRKQWSSELKTLGGTGQDGPAFGDSQVWEIMKENYPEYFVNVKALQSLKQIKAEMTAVAGKDGESAPAVQFKSCARALQKNRLRAGKYVSVLAWADFNVGQLEKDIATALRKLQGRERELSLVATIISAFALDWRYGTNQYMNFLIMGPAGSGKTTLATYMGRMLQHAGLVFRKGPMVETTRTDFIGQYLGQSGPKTNSQLEAARERVLFIDEAYALAKCSKRGPGYSCDQWDQYSTESMTALVAFLSQNIGQIIVIAAGYQSDMYDTFMAINEGIPRRFPNVVVLRPMTDEKLLEIFYSVLRSKDVGGPRGTGGEDLPRRVSQEANDVLLDVLRHDKPRLVDTSGSLKTMSRSVFKYEASDMVNLANQIVTYMLTRNKGKGVLSLSKCAMVSILNKIVFDRLQKYIVSDKCDAGVKFIHDR